ncbi:Nramp family divalent metal transporter [Pseudolysinimonas sp.]|uniref:Nramp family divalent metal transporter n=1 Tax=Pseudolysinimonas sp. TaxID=2680009 RepID=UPI003F7F7626
MSTAARARTGSARPPGRFLALLGPAMVAGVAYLDPGNVASNATAGARFGYLLVWVVLLANATAWLVQYLSAKLGLGTGRSLPGILGERLRRPLARRLFWAQAELVAMATDIAEVLGGAIALQLLFGLPLVVGGALTGVVSMVLLVLHNRRGSRSFEAVVVGLLVVIAVGFCAGIVAAPLDGAEAVGGLVPRFEGTGSVLLAASIVGATVMPHAIYAHSALARDRFGLVAPDQRRRVLLATRVDVTVALAVAGTVNVVILLLSAATLRGVDGTDTLPGAYRAIGDALGPVVATLFAVGLLASGLASTSVGAYAGAEIMAGLLQRRIPLLLRRVITLVPALVILLLGVDPTFALVLSQVALSFGIPFALVPLVWLTAQRRVLGESANRWWTTALAALAAMLLIGLNVALLALTIAG